MKTYLKSITVYFLFVLATLMGNTSRAEVVGWWRFEDEPGFTADSSGNGFDLSSEGDAPFQVPAEKGFHNPLPQTEDANLKAAHFNGAGNFYITNKKAFNFAQHLTVEAYFHVDSWPESVGVLAGQFACTLHQQSWFFGIRDNGELMFRVSSIGNAFASYSSDVEELIEPGKDYYAAVVFNGAATQCMFYLKNLTDGSDLMQSVTNNINVSALFNSPANLNIGSVVDASTAPGDVRLYFNGRIDELRISDTSLVPEQFLINEAAETENIIGYWRFEDSPGFLEDSGSQNLTLSRTDENWPQAATPGIVGRVPLTREFSFQHANFGTDQLGWFTTPAPTTGYYISGNFTIEAFVRQTAINLNTVYIFSQWNASSSERKCAFFIGDGGTYPQGGLCLSLSPNGVSTVVIKSDWDKVVELDKDLYVAVSFDLKDKESGVTFYYRNLTDDGSLYSKKVGHSLNTLYSSSADFKLGTLDVSKRCWLGCMDEVRIACAVLPEERLLGFTPPPSATIMIIQ